MGRASRNLLVVTLAVLVLAACGRRGPLDTPKASPETTAPVNPDGTPRTGGKPFILDPLVR